MRSWALVVLILCGGCDDRLEAWTSWDYWITSSEPGICAEQWTRGDTVRFGTPDEHGGFTMAVGDDTLDCRGGTDAFVCDPLDGLDVTGEFTQPCAGYTVTLTVVGGDCTRKLGATTVEPSTGECSRPGGPGLTLGTFTPD
ncbi:MAG: hypothetical protein R3F61_07225 [Myxococcota bacterium]